MEKEISCYRDKITELEEMNEELRQDTDSCREKEAELLMFTEKLTAKNVTLQSEYAILEAKVSVFKVICKKISQSVFWFC